MSIREFDVRYTLTTADGREGTGLLSKPGSFKWTSGDPEGDGETTEVWFELLDEEGMHIEGYHFDGDDWRELEDNGKLDDILTWVRRGADLEEAVVAALEERDPDGFDSEKEEQIERLEAENARLRKALEQLREDALARDNEMDDPHGDGRGTDSRPPDGDDYNDLLGDVKAAISVLEG